MSHEAEMRRILKGKKKSRKKLAAELREAVEAVRPKPGSGITSVSITCEGRGAVLHSDGRTESVG